MYPSPKQDVLAISEHKVRERELIATIQGLVQELHSQRAKSLDVNASSRLERDLGIDSLARTELILRIEKAFGVRLPAAAAGAAETVRDLLLALEEAHPAPSAKAVELGIAPLPPCATCRASANAGRGSGMALGHASRPSTLDRHR